MLIQLLLAAAGLVLLTVAADHLVVGSSRLAARMRIRPVVVGVVVIGIGTSMPEFLVSGVAAARGEAGIALGNLIGSNILNLTLILGIAGLIARIGFASTVIRREVPLAVAGTVLFAALAWTGLTVVTGVVLAVAGGAALWLLVRWAGDSRNGELAEEAVECVAEAPAGPGGSARFEPLRAVLGLAGVLVGAQLLVVNASAIAAGLGVSPLVIGFTLVALGTSLPELVTTVQAQRRGESELVIGNLFGSNLFNSLIGGTVVSLAAPAGIGAANGLLLLLMVLTSLAAWGLLVRGMVLTRAEGALLLAAYLATVPLLLTA
ncbi:cation:H+ antiporter [Actinoplanes octamycinicus]|uniref:Cation:H+ antiporter n=1 Tax=Actinoplanes octamycinicus TaxID=135948 RepID=A0A7W7H0V6_9ACTN|nr:calcium/sodium antiporter [Actinoplanes octamycinicus]MBB4741822.1 cation:H+ antiporter [Actinoplanes octamycinicus]GIE57380.1 calcium/sodium antiporter [Actinoplanes octamycinicus]